MEGVTSSTSINRCDDGGNKFVILLGWTGSELRHLSKYTTMYLKRNYHTIQQAVFFFMPNTKQDLDKWAEKVKTDCQNVISLLHQNMDKKTEKAECIFHIFSNGGIEYYVPLVEILQTSSIPHKIIASIFDSSPSLDNSISTIAKVTAAQYQNKILSFLAYWRVMFMRSAFLGNINEKCRYQFDKLQTEPIKSVPVLFLYSREDNITSAVLLEEYIQRVRKENENVYSHCFQGTSHVAHFFFKPEEYEQQVFLFLENVNRIGNRSKL